MPATLADLADRFDCELRGDGAVTVERVAALGNAGADAVAFLANPHYRPLLAGTAAAAVILEETLAAECPTGCLISANPYVTYARVAAYLHPHAAEPPGIHPSAVVADAAIGERVHVGPQAVIGAGARIGDDVSIGAGSIVGAGSEIGRGTRLAARVTLAERVRLGQRCIVHSGAVIGADGFGFARDEPRWVKVPQIGSVVVGDDVEIGANTTIDRGAIEDTTIGDGVKIDNLVQIAHNVTIGEHSAIAALAGIAGSTRIGKRCMIGGAVTMLGHLEICDDVKLLFGSVVLKSVTAPGAYSGSLPAAPAGQWRRNAVRFGQLDALAARIKAVEGRLDESRGSPGGPSNTKPQSES